MCSTSIYQKVHITLRLFIYIYLHLISFQAHLQSSFSKRKFFLGGGGGDGRFNRCDGRGICLFCIRLCHCGGKSVTHWSVLPQQGPDECDGLYQKQETAGIWEKVHSWSGSRVLLKVLKFFHVLLLFQGQSFGLL